MGSFSRSSVVSTVHFTMQTTHVFAAGDGHSKSARRPLLRGPRHVHNRIETDAPLEPPAHLDRIS